MPEKGDLPQEVEFFFEYDPGYRIISTNGVWGGLTPRGEFRLDFFVESVGIPDSVKNKITAEGKLGEEITRQPEKRFVRRLQVGVLLSQIQAEALSELIQERIKDIKDIKGKTEERKAND